MPLETASCRRSRPSEQLNGSLPATDAGDLTSLREDDFLIACLTYELISSVGFERIWTGTLAQLQQSRGHAKETYIRHDSE